jgi:hypothetical protein
MRSEMRWFKKHDFTSRQSDMHGVEDSFHHAKKQNLQNSSQESAKCFSRTNNVESNVFLTTPFCDIARPTCLIPPLSLSLSASLSLPQLRVGDHRRLHPAHAPAHSARPVVRALPARHTAQARVDPRPPAAAHSAVRLQGRGVGFRVLLVGVGSFCALGARGM